jgi:hypothetical protein
MPIDNVLNFWCATLTVPTTAVPFFKLAQTFFAANRTGDAIDSAASSVVFQAGLGNGTTVIYLGDKTLNVTAAPTVGVGIAITVTSQPQVFTIQGAGRHTLDLNNFYLQASATATPYLNVFVYKE